MNTPTVATPQGFNDVVVDFTAPTCYICGQTEHAPTPLHTFWSNADAAREFAQQPEGRLPSMSAVETLDPREAVYEN